MELPMTLSTFGLTRLSNSRTVWQPHYARRVLITDAAAIVLAMLFAQWVRFGGAGYGPSASMGPCPHVVDTGFVVMRLRAA